jgi:hypothetical protein
MVRVALTVVTLFGNVQNAIAAIEDGDRERLELIYEEFLHRRREQCGVRIHRTQEFQLESAACIGRSK